MDTAIATARRNLAQRKSPVHVDLIGMRNPIKSSARTAKNLSDGRLY
jgi:hypothetical protein